MNSSVHRKSQTTLSSKKGMLNPLPVYGGERQRALEDKIHESNTLLEQIKLTQWQKAYSYIEINTDQFKSVFLQQNKHFEVCLSVIQEFNEEVRKSRQDQSEIRNGPWKQKFCNQLQLLLREILFTRDRIIQKTFCEKVCTWAVDQLEQLEVAAETQLYETMESLNAKVSLTRPDSAVSAITGATNILGSRLFSASSTNLGRRPKSGVLRGLDKSLMPQLNSTQSTMRPESAFNSSLRPESAAYYSKIDLIRPESSTNFKKIRPGSAVNFNTKQARPISSILRPISSVLRPESAFIKEDIENEEPEKSNKHKEGEYAIEEIEEGKKEDDLDFQIEQQLQSQFGANQQSINKLHKDRIRVDLSAANLQPSQQIEQLLQDYKTKARTKIDGVEPPAERLHNYVRKKLIPDDLEKKEDPTKDSSKKDIASDYANLRWTFPKPEIFLPSQQQQLQSVDVPHEEVIAGQASPQAAAAAVPAGPAGAAAAGEAQPQEGQELQQQQSGEQVEGDKPDGKAGGDEKDKEKKEVNIVPDTKNFTIDANSKETFVRNLNKKFEMRSTFTNYEPTDDLREMRMEAKWIEGRNRELNNKRQDEERIAMVKEWSLAKGRIEKEINRKIDSSVYGSKFVQCDYRPRPYTAKELRDIDKNTLTRKIANNNFFKESQQEGESHYEEQSHQGEGFSQMHEEIRGEDEEESERSHQDGHEGSEGQEDGDGEDGAMIAEQDNDGVDDDEEEEEMMAQLENMGVPRVGQYRGSKIAIPRMTAVIDGTKSVPVLAKADKFVNIDKNIDDMEYQISKEKISQIRKLYGATINVAKSKELEDERPDIKSTSLSVYSKDRRSHIIRPFSAVLSRVTVNHVRKDQVDEIEQVKKVLAKYNLNVQTNSIKRALLVPEGNLGVDAGILPEPGQGLFNNPFMKTKKKKKKKGKKKSKK